MLYAINFQTIESTAPKTDWAITFSTKNGFQPEKYKIKLTVEKFEFVVYFTVKTAQIDVEVTGKKDFFTFLNFNSIQHRNSTFC